MAYLLSIISTLEGTLPPNLGFLCEPYTSRNLLTPDKIGNIIPLPDQGSRSSHYKDPKGLYDVKTNLIKSIVHSSLGCNENTVTLAYRLYCVYRAFPDHLLKSALQELNQIHLLSAKKAHIRRQQPRRRLVLPMPYQFSATYIFTQMPDYPIQVYKEAKDFLINMHQFKDANGYYSLEKFEQGHNVGFSETIPHIDVKLLFEIPEEALRLNPQIEDHSELIKELAQRYLHLLKKKRVENDFETENVKGYTEQLQKSEERTIQRTVPNDAEITIEKVIEKVIKAYDCSDVKQRQALQKSIEADLQNLDTNPDDDDEEEESSNSEPLLSTAAGRFDREKNTLNAADSSKSTEKTSLFSTNENPFLPTLEEVMVGMMQSTVVGEKRKIPHITELSVLLSKGMFPEGTFDDDDERLDRLSKHFVMTFPTAKMHLLEDIEQNQFYEYFKNFAEDCIAVVDFIRNDHIVDNICSSEELIQEELEQRNNSQELLRWTRNIINFIDSKKDLGATIQEIKVFSLP